jgi:membrane associated rhomboid family serine protease
MGALVVAGRHLRADITQVLVLIGINVVIGFIAPGIDWRAHLGGLLTGAAVAFVFSKAPTGPRQTLVQVVGLSGIVLVLAAASLYRADQIQALIPIG